MQPATVIIDNGTGFTKMGYAGNMEPSYIIPTVVADSVVSCGKSNVFRKNSRKISSRTQNLTSSLAKKLNKTQKRMSLKTSLGVDRLRIGK